MIITKDRIQEKKEQENIWKGQRIKNRLRKGKRQGVLFKKIFKNLVKFKKSIFR